MSTPPTLAAPTTAVAAPADPSECPGPLESVAVVDGQELCTVGDEGKAQPVDATEAPTAAPAAAAGLACVGDGTDGHRVEILYARASDATGVSGLSIRARSIRTIAAETDTIFNASAAETGGVRHIRWLMDSNCELTLKTVVLSPTGDDSFADTVSDLIDRGYDRPDRKYLVFVENRSGSTPPVCSAATTILSDDPEPATNLNDTSTGYVRMDLANGFPGFTCWGASHAAHELMHTFGAVQPSAPNGTADFHCRDEHDLMCNSDHPGAPLIACPDPAHEARFDCNHDDYFTTALPPPGSYLDSHWNAADSSWLTDAPVPVPPPNDAMATPTELPDLVSPTDDSFTGVTTDATFEPGEPDPSWLSDTATKRTIWYRFTSQVTGKLRIDTLGSDFDTWLALYDDCTCGVGNGIAHNDDIDASTPQSRIDVTVLAGETYYLQVDGRRPARGNVVLNRDFGTLPSAPTSVNVVTGDRQATVSWTPPDDPGSTPITHYRVLRNSGPGFVTVYTSPDDSARSFLNVSLTNGTTYTYQVRAVNGTGDGPGATASAVPSTVPTVPRFPAATPGDGQVQLTWLQPASSGGAPVTGYNVYRDGHLAATVTTPGFTDLGLTNGVARSYTVGAVNVNGEGPRTAPVAATPDSSGIAGTVTEEGTAAPVAGAWVVAHRPSDLGLVRAAVTDADGAFHLDVPPGSFLLQVADPLSRHRPEWHADQPTLGNLGDLTPVTVAVASTATVDVDLAPALGALEGTVTGEDTGQGLGGALVVAVRDGAPAGSDLTGADGSYRIGGLRAGSYLLVFAEPSAGHLAEFFDAAPGPAAAQSVAIVGGEATVVHASLTPTALPAPTGAVTGEVTDEVTGEPIEGAFVVAHRDSDLSFAGAAAVASDGGYELDLPAGRFYLEAAHPSGGYTHEWFDDAHAPTSVADMESVEAGDTADFGLLPTAGAVAGTITDRTTGAPIGAAWVALVDSSGLVIGAVADDHGEYRIDDLPTDNYLAVFVDPTGVRAPEFHENRPDPSVVDRILVTGGAAYVLDAALG